MSNFPTSTISSPTNYYLDCMISGCSSCTEIYSNYFTIEISLCTPSISLLNSVLLIKSFSYISSNTTNFEIFNAGLYSTVTPSGCSLTYSLVYSNGTNYTCS